MESKCRFPSCSWTGDVNDIFEHCEVYHRKYVKEISAKNSYSFTFDEIMYNYTFLLNGTAGLYWFTLDDNEEEDCMRRGIFAIGESEVCKYTLKIGLINDGHVIYMGPHTTRPETSEDYDLQWSYLDWEFYKEEISSRRVDVFFGDYKDDEEYKGNYLDVDWDDPEEEEYNKWCLEKFTCFICYEYIRSNARFCENQHFLCRDCLEKLIEQGKPKCPMCRGDYPYDCHNEDIEQLLRCVRFPENDNDT